MRKIYSLLCFIACFFISCLEDKGSDIYKELNDATIKSIKDTIIEQFTRFQISPEIIVSDNHFDPERYDYVWHMYGINNGFGNATVSDTLSYEKDLDVEITSKPGDYVLVFTMIDKETGIKYTPERQTVVTVINSYSVGMMVLSRVGRNANLTFINKVGSVVQDAYEKVNKEVAGKNPVKVRYVTSIVSSAAPMVVILADDERGGVVVEPLDLSYVMDFSELFYFVPGIVKPQSYGTHEVTTREYVINDGSLYVRDVMNNAGLYPKFGVRIKGDYERLAPFDFFSTVSPQSIYFYDQGKEHFVYMKQFLEGDAVIHISAAEGEFNPNNVGMQMIWGGLFGSMYAMPNGRAVMEDHSGVRYTISFLAISESTMTPLKKHRLPDNGQRAHTFTTSQNANFLYYAYDNKIACVSFDTGNLLSEYTVDGGKVDYIECDQLGDINQMWVGISDGTAVKNSGTILVLRMGTDGSLEEVTRYPNVCGQVVDFEYKK